jgi:hypothetical protein
MQSTNPEAEMPSEKVAMSRKQIGGEVPLVASELTDLLWHFRRPGVDPGEFLTTRDLKSVLNVALEMTGYRIERNGNESMSSRQARKALV